MKDEKSADLISFYLLKLLSLKSTDLMSYFIDHLSEKLKIFSKYQKFFHQLLEISTSEIKQEIYIHMISSVPCKNIDSAIEFLKILEYTDEKTIVEILRSVFKNYITNRDTQSKIRLNNLLKAYPNLVVKVGFEIIRKLLIREEKNFLKQKVIKCLKERIHLIIDEIAVGSKVLEIEIKSRKLNDI